MNKRAAPSSATPNLLQQLLGGLPVAERLHAHKFAVRRYLQALRPHQWIKNVLVALPAIAGHDFSANTLVTVLVAIVSFSLCASSAYLINDILDLPHDRAHPQKRNRPIAAGTVSLNHATILIVIAALLSLALGLVLPPIFAVILAIYFALSITYTVYLKRKLMIDVVALAALYGIRVLAGGAATGIPLSHWLVGFCFFIFLSLALVKRTTEMMTLPESSVDALMGRDYRRQDLQTIIALTAASGFVAVLVLALYVSSPEITVLYRHADLLWGICIILVYWLGRVCILTGRGEMHQDPVIFAVTDRISLLAGLAVVATFIVAL